MLRFFNLNEEIKEAILEAADLEDLRQDMVSDLETLCGLSLWSHFQD